MTNTEIARIFNDIAAMLELQNANRFRVRAYENAALAIEQHPLPMSELYAQHGKKALLDIPGIGADLAQKIEELVTTGALAYYKDQKKIVPAGLLEVMAIEGMGPAKTRDVWKAYGVTTVEQLKKAARFGSLKNRKGWGQKSVENVLRGIALRERYGDRLPIGMVRNTVESIMNQLKASRLASKLDSAGSYRRGKETVGDLDFVAASTQPKKLIELFSRLPEVKDVEVKGETKCTVFLHIGIDADLRVVAPNAYGAALYYSTGSQTHNVAARQRALSMGMTVNEYGIFKLKSRGKRARTAAQNGNRKNRGTCVASKTERDMFRALKLPYIPPELRENLGEFERLPKNLLEEKHLRGDMHMHTVFSDGDNTALEMIKAAKARGMKYIAITDHASPMGMVKGLKTNNITKYRRMVEAAAKKVSGIAVLVGSEVDILPDGSLYLPHNALKKLDWVIASLHGSFRQSKQEMTRRVERALENPFVHVFGHPTGRNIGQREPVDFDFKKVLACSKKHNVLLEINGQWPRLDLNDVHCREAALAGNMMVLSSDSHSKNNMDPYFGVLQARRGWVSKNLVLNTKPFADVKKWLKKKSKGR